MYIIDSQREATLNKSARALDILVMTQGDALHSRQCHFPNTNDKEIKTMSKNELISKIEALNEWEALMEEAKAEAEAIRDSIKAEMLDRDTEELTAGQYIIRWTPVLSNRFDSTAFKKMYGDLYKAFTKQTASRRFSISC